MKNLLTKLYALTVAVCLLAAWSCSSDDGTTPDIPGGEEYKRLVSGVVLDNEYEVEKGGQITLTGSGFASGDYMELRGNNIRCTTASVDNTSLSFIVPDEVVSGTSYRFALRRGNSTHILGSAVIKLKVKDSLTDVPDKDGMNIKGLVYCGLEPVAGALVSDGVQIVQTDENGHYWIASSKRHGSVFIITPSGYEVATKEAMPQFWQKLTKGQGEVEQHDFELFERNNDNHIMLVATDMHLANRNSDIQQFTTGWVSEVTSTYNNSATPVYCLNLGDWAWDLYWYQNNFSLVDAKKAVKDLDFQFWSTMGNHDNDAAYQGDWEPEQAFRDEVGPVFYSMNIGKVHYIMLDDTVYKNTGTPGHSTIVGDRGYDKYFTADNINYVKEDLKYVDPSTPIFVGFHCPLKTMSYNSANGWYANDAISQTYQKQLLECFAGYENVTLLSGHSHVNRNIPIEGYATKMIEQNVAAVCGTWWWTYRYANNNVCTDGSPAGYKVFTANGDQITYKYKGMGLSIDKQFQTYDMNEFMKWWDSSATQAFKNKLPARANDYADISSTSNTVYINVWAWEPSWKVEVKENGKSLEVKQIRKYDPLHSASYDVPRGASSSLSFPSDYTCHMFAVTASSATSTLDITVTDSFGVTYSETMTRPKSFTTKYE